MDMEINKLKSIEKAVSKFECMVAEYRQKAFDETEPHERSFYFKAQGLIWRAEEKHKEILVALWEEGIFP